MSTHPHTTPLFVRLPAAEAEKLDRAAFELRAPKQSLVAGLVSRYVDPGSAAGLAELRELSDAHNSRSGRRTVTIETEPDALTVGRHSFLPAELGEVLTLQQAAELLQAEEEAVAALAEGGELPGRLIGGEWRFARAAVLDWLGGGAGRE